jgi:hypothetical protein
LDFCGFLFARNFFVATFVWWKVATFRLAFCVLGCFYGLELETFCGMRLLGLRLGCRGGDGCYFSSKEEA